MLQRAVELLRPGCVAGLRRLEDWHEHDGFGVDSREATWQELRSATTTERALWAASSDEWEVRMAWYPANFSFLLRWVLLEDWLDDPASQGSAPGGDVELVVDGQLATTFRDAVASTCSDVEVEPAGEYFDRTYGG